MKKNKKTKDKIPLRSKYKEKNKVILNTPHFATQIIENKHGVILEIFHRHGELIDSFSYFNDDVIE